MRSTRAWWVLVCFLVAVMLVSISDSTAARELCQNGPEKTEDGSGDECPDLNAPGGTETCLIQRPLPVPGKSDGQRLKERVNRGVKARNAR